MQIWTENYVFYHLLECEIVDDDVIIKDRRYRDFKLINCIINSMPFNYIAFYKNNIPQENCIVRQFRWVQEDAAGNKNRRI